MKRNGQKSACMKRIAAILLGVFIILGFSANADAQWKYGIGTGIGALSFEGKVGFDTLIAGPLKFDVDMDPSDVNDAIDTAFGFQGYATDGMYLIKYSYSTITLEGDGNNGVTFLDAEFEANGAEVTLAYPIYQVPGAKLSVLGGVRWTSHELKINVTSGIFSSGVKVDKDWYDAIVGLTLDVPFYEKWNWGSQVDAGFGGSNSTYTVATGLGWRFFDNWSASLGAAYRYVKFEDHNQASPDWYLYDMDETSARLG
ncbi:MAG: hypothetical protein V3W18_07865, partial [candidate division Zixibacteria bacterium]